MGRQNGGSFLIRGGTVIDGSGARGRRADVRVRGDRIDAVGEFKPEPGEVVVDAGGRVVTPGFIDAHSHADGGIVADPNAETQIRQGITTSCVGQDGSSNSPLKQWFGKIAAAGVALNFGSFVGHGSARSLAMGKDYKRPATAGEIVIMCQFVDREMQAGGLGLSSGLEYDPGLYSTTDELIALARVAGTHGGIYISHVRDEENKALDSFTELIRIAREGHLPAQISHIKLASSNVWGKTGDVFRLMDKARAEGLDISADVYPYNYWQSTIIVLIPTRDWADRAAWAKGLAEVGGPANVLLTSFTPSIQSSLAPSPPWAGHTIAEISKMTGQDPVSVIQQIVKATHGDGSGKGSDKGGESVVVTAMREDDVRAFIRDRRIMFCTDGGLHPTHPRGAGSFPRLLGRYVRQDRLLTLEEAIHKATSLPAKRMGFKGRGMIAPGYKADLVLFDPRTILDTATTKDPTSKPIGLDDVFVNGMPVLKSGQFTGNHPGQVLRRER